jgi:hypothetical protein
MIGVLFTDYFSDKRPALFQHHQVTDPLCLSYHQVFIFSKRQTPPQVQSETKGSNAQQVNGIKSDSSGPLLIRVSSYLIMLSNAFIATS